MTLPVVVLRTSEISLKGGNRHLFEKQLAHNVKRTLKNNNISYTFTQRLKGRLLVYFQEFEEQEKASRVLGFVFGVSTYSPGVIAEKSMSEIERAVDIFTKRNFNKFRVRAKRQDKRFALTSMGLEKEIGSYICNNYSKVVDLKNYDVNFLLEVCEDGVVVSVDNFNGQGGLPVGTGGKVGVLAEYENPELAAYYMMKRGCEVVFIGHHAFEYLQTYNNFEEAKVIVTDDILGTIENEKLNALVAGSQAQELAGIKKEYRQELVLAPLVGFLGDEIKEKKKAIAKNI